VAVAVIAVMPSPIIHFIQSPLFPFITEELKTKDFQINEMQTKLSQEQQWREELSSKLRQKVRVVVVVLIPGTDLLTMGYVAFFLSVPPIGARSISIQE